jgi:DNA repair protein RecO (recombination protein O)
VLFRHFGVSIVPTITDTAICIRHWDFSETSQTVSLFTREHGMIRGLAKGSRRAKGSFSGGIDVLTRGQVIAIVRPGRDLATLTSWSLEDLFRHVRTDLQANRAGLFMADLLHHLVHDHDPHSRLFDAFNDAITTLRTPERTCETLLVFQMRLLQETGYRPHLEHDVVTGQPLDAGRPLAFDPYAGGIVTGAPDRGRIAWRVRPETIELLRMVQRGIEPSGTASAATPSQNVAHGPFDPATCDRAIRLLAAYLRELIGEEPPSMRWAFSDPRAPMSPG